MRTPYVVEWQKLSRAIADAQEALADELPRWFCRLTDADERLREYAMARRVFAAYIETAWWAYERGEYEMWLNLTTNQGGMK